MSENIMIAMSGGVDSSVAAWLIRKLGGEVAGLTLRLHDPAPGTASELCGGEEEIRQARAIAERLGIPHHTLDGRADFARIVIGNFIAAYENGETPNPCVVCNRHIKFDLLHAHARELGYDKVATGHYAEIERDGERYLLKRAPDPTKDQSYVLYSLSQEQLSRTLFPLGGLSKSEVRQIAAENGFENAQKKDSQDICFIPDGDYVRFIETYAGRHYPPGHFLDTAGNILGRHNGIIRYTIGQRKGLGIAFGRPMFVASKDPIANTITLSDNEGLFRPSLTAKELRLIPFDRLETGMRLQAKVRYNQAAQWARVEPIGEDRIQVLFDTPQRAIARGQSVVLYDGDYVVGGAIIE